MTIVVADTTCSLPQDLLKERGVPLIPQVVIFGEDSYHDDKDLDTETFLYPNLCHRDTNPPRR